MGEIANAMRLLQGGLPTVVTRYPSGKFGFVGSIPMECTKRIGGLFPQNVSQVYETEQDAINAAFAAGVSKLQGADCRWISK